MAKKNTHGIAPGYRISYIAGGKLSRLEGKKGQRVEATVQLVDGNDIHVMPDYRKLPDMKTLRRIKLDAKIYWGLGAVIGFDDNNVWILDSGRKSTPAEWSLNMRRIIKQTLPKVNMDLGGMGSEDGATVTRKQAQKLANALAEEGISWEQDSRRGYTEFAEDECSYGSLLIETIDDEPHLRTLRWYCP